MLTQTLGWLALLIGLLGTWLLPYTRHGWLLAIACGIAWAVVDIRIALWSGLAAAALSIGVNWRCWRHRVTATVPLTAKD